MKFVVLIIDGASGWPHPDLGGLTSLQAARTPHLDDLARAGTVGLVHTIPEGMEPSSAVGCMSVLGFDPALYYAGRGPIEAMALGVDLQPGQVALRCNLVSIEDGLMRSYSAGSIPSTESHPLMEAVAHELAAPGLQFHPGLGFRHILTVSGHLELLQAVCTPAHDLADKPVDGNLPRGPGSELLVDLMERSKPVLALHPLNRARRERGEPAATQIWLFWPGERPGTMPTFAAAYGQRSVLTSAVDLLRGLAKQARIDFLTLPGVTDGSDNDYEGQMRGALDALSDHDVVMVHIEAPDDAGHRGDPEAKVRAIEAIDELMVAQLLSWRGDVGLLVQPDHPTPLALKTHVAEPVPFLLWGAGHGPNGAARLTETQAAATGLVVRPGHTMMGRLLKMGHDTGRD